MIIPRSMTPRHLWLEISEFHREDTNNLVLWLRIIVTVTYEAANGCVGSCCCLDALPSRFCEQAHTAGAREPQLRVSLI